MFTDDLGVLVPLFAIFCIFGLPILAWMSMRFLAYRERMEMIRHGIVPPPQFGRGRRDARMYAAPPPYGAYQQPHVNAGTVSPFDPNEAQCTLHKGIRIAAIGFAVTLGLSFIGLHDGEWHPGPWLLGGLVPLFVGIAQIITALLSGAIAAPQSLAPPPLYGVPPPPQAPGAPGPAPTYEGSYTYRPGAAQELRSPPQPPNRT